MVATRRGKVLTGLNLVSLCERYTRHQTQQHRSTLQRLIISHRRHQQLMKQILMNMLQLWFVNIRLFTPFHTLLDLDTNFVGVVQCIIDVNDFAHVPPSVLWFLTGETPDTFSELVQIIRERVLRPLENNVIRRNRRMSVRSEILLTLIWVRHYKKYATLSCSFGISIHHVHAVIRHVILACNAVLVPREVHWHTVDNWDMFLGKYVSDVYYSTNVYIHIIYAPSPKILIIP